MYLLISKCKIHFKKMYIFTCNMVRCIYWSLDVKCDSYIEDFETFKRSGLFLYTNYLISYLFTLYNNKVM